MKKWLKKIVNFLLLGTMVLSGVACKGTGDSSSVNRAPMTDEAAPVLTSTTDTTIANMDRTNIQSSVSRSVKMASCRTSLTYRAETELSTQVIIACKQDNPHRASH